MERENFYVLLELPVDPPEEDPKKIEEAIKRLQAKWSRFRNHPTKSIQAKKILGMLPEIRKIMADPDLRREEAERAKSFMAEANEQRFSGVDRHLTIHMSKGYVTDDEIIKLSKLHGVSEADIRERIRQMEEAKFAEIDNAINIRLTKGYVTEEEVSRIAKKHAIAEDVVRKRVTGPIRKEGDGPVTLGRGMDASLLKVIEDNLAIVGKTSLYDFLDVEPNASLKLLQKKAHKKETEALKIGRKDAVVTATASLAGHCASVFKDEESRQAYDVSRAKRHLKDLDQDIDVAGMEGKIRAEYFHTLVQTAQQFGMDEEESRQYITDYAEQKGWSIEGAEPEKKEKKPKNFKKLFIVLGILVLLLGAAGVGSFLYLGSMAREKAFNKAMEEASSKKSLEERIRVLQDYLNRTPDNDYTAKAREEIAGLKESIARRDFLDARKQADELIQADRLEEAQAVLETFLKTHPSGKTAANVRKEIDGIDTQIDDRDFAALEAMAGDDVDRRMAAYIAYWKKHPEGNHKDEVNNFIWDAGEEYYISIRKKLDKLEAEEDWAKAIQWVDVYLNIYEDKNRRAVELAELKNKYRVYQRELAAYQALVRKAETYGTDYDGARGVYEDFIRAYPGTYVEPKIRGKMLLLDQEKELARIEAARNKVRKAIQGSERFSENRKDTIFDAKTGLTWTLLDSVSETGKCVDYFGARKYASQLKKGGYTDWRLPTVEELTGIYKEKNPLPHLEEHWFWSSKSFKAWKDQWVQVVEVVNNRPEAESVQDTRDSYMCGAVMAVRP